MKVDLSILLLISLALSSILHGAEVRQPTTFYVSKSTGNDANAGTTREKPLRTIQAGADKLQAGDTLVVLPGIYYEQVSMKAIGTREKSVTYLAEGKVIVTGANEDIREKRIKWDLVDEALQLYSAPHPHYPSRVLYSGIDLAPYPTLESLKTFSHLGRPDGPHCGFTYDHDAKRVYVRLHLSGKYGSRNPNDHVMSVGRPPAPNFNGTGIWQLKDSNFHNNNRVPIYTIIDGFEFETPGSAGIVTGGGNIVVRNCRFKGCRAGVWGFRNAHEIFVENCEYDQAYAYQDSMDLLEYYKTHDRGETPLSLGTLWMRKICNTDQEKLIKNYEMGIVGGVGRGWHVRDNLIHETFEGLSCWCVDNASDLQIYGNTFRRNLDNAIETENHAKNVRIYNNHIVDCMEPISFQPLAGLPWPGPIFVYRNVIESSLAVNNAFKTVWKPGLFKIGVSQHNWRYDSMGNAEDHRVDGVRISKQFVFVDYPGFMVFNNTLIFPGGAAMTHPQPITRDLINFRFFNNAISCDGWRANPTPKDVRIRPMEFWRNAWHDSAKFLDQRQDVAARGGKIFDDFDGLGIQDKFPYLPLEHSPLCKLGITTFGEPDSSADAGATPFGGTWEVASGIGQGEAYSTLSPFRKTIAYNAQLIRSHGPKAGRWGVWSDNTPVQLELHDFNTKHSALKLVWRPSTWLPKRNFVPPPVLKIDGFTIAGAVADGTIKISNGNQEMLVKVDDAKRDFWQTWNLAWHNDELTVTVDGNQATTAKLAKPTGNIIVQIDKIPIFELKAE